MTLRIAIIGYGTIAREQHVPSIRANPDMTMAAVVSHSGQADVDCPTFKSTHDLLSTMGGHIDAVAICTPPNARTAIAQTAILAGVAVLMEKPPTATFGESAALVSLAQARGVPLYTAWHSQHAAGVAAAADALVGETITKLRMTWHEDVRKWHPGQEWIWQPGGFGVFDPGINGFSILTRILPEPLILETAVLHTPANRQTPIAADITFAGGDCTASLDWRRTKDEDWRIAIETASGKTLALTRGGAELAINGKPQSLPPHDEYRSIYADFANHFTRGASSIDLEPLRMVADAFLIGRRDMVADFV